MKDKKPYIGEPMKSLKEAEEKKKYGQVVYGSTEPTFVKNIYQRMIQVMKEVEYIQKIDKAAKGLPYKFISHDQVTGKLHMPMANAGIVAITSVVECIQDGNRTTVKIKLALVNADDSKDYIEVFSYGMGVDTQDKGIGKAISYATKYALLKCFMLETGDDPERDNVDYKPDLKKMVDHAESLIIQLPVDRVVAVEERMQAKFKTKDFSKLDLEALKTVTLFLEAEKRKQSAKPKEEADHE